MISNFLRSILTGYKTLEGNFNNTNVNNSTD